MNAICSVCSAYPDTFTPPCGHFRALPADGELVISSSRPLPPHRAPGLGWLYFAFSIPHGVWTFQCGPNSRQAVAMSWDESRAAERRA